MNSRLLHSLAYLGPFLMWCFLSAPLTAQVPRLLSIGRDVPCDSTFCDSLVISNDLGKPLELLGIDLRDSISYQIDFSPQLPAQILPGIELALPVCFTPNRRGNISDSITVFTRTLQGSLDTSYVRVIGRGIGPNLLVDPSVLNFPKTNPGGSSTLSMRIINNGERSFRLDASALNIPAPFRLVTTLPLDIPAGDSVTITLAFEPVDNGVYSAPVDLLGGCDVRVQLGLNGVTDLIGTGAVLRISKVGFNPANSEQTPCDIARCTDVTLSNVGNAPLNIESLGWLSSNPIYTLSSAPSVPFLIAANSERRITVCLDSRERGILRDTLMVQSNTRSSIAFGMVIDISASMEAPMICDSIQSTRIAQADIQARNFIARTLLHLPTIGIQDQLAICTYTTSPFNLTKPDIVFLLPLTFINDKTRQDAQDSVAGLISRGSTPTGTALNRMMDTLANSPLANRVIVLLTDGETRDAKEYPVSQIVARAQSMGIKIFSIGIDLTEPNAVVYLEAIASGTGGKNFDAKTCASLQGAFETITDIISRGSRSYEPFAITVTSPLLVATPNISFDSTQLGHVLCESITLTNVGEGDAIIDSMVVTDLLGGTTGDFAIGSGLTFPIIVQENQQATIPICFTPTRIRMRDGKGSITYNNCDQGPLSVGFNGPGYAYAGLRITDERIGLPGDVVLMPVYADTSLADYGVNSITYTVRWNKSMLDLLSVRPGSANPAATVSITTPVVYGARDATVGITVTGTSLAGSGEIAQLEFKVLRGDSLASSVVLLEGNVADGNPRTLLHNAGMIAFDSTCFRDYKSLETPGVAAKIIAGEASPAPARDGVITISLVADGPAALQFSLYSTDGALVRQPLEQIVEAGMSEVRISIEGLSSGSYYVLLRTSSGETLVRKIMVAR